MSLKFLKALNGDNQGAFCDWLRPWLQSKDCPRIAWYPSAGGDFRDLLYLNQRYVDANFKKPNEAPQEPDIYLHTDYLYSSFNYQPLFDSIRSGTGVLFKDQFTEIEILKSEELSRCPLERAPELILDTKPHEASDRVFFLELEVRSGSRPTRQLGTWKVPLLYAFVENTAFCFERLRPLDARISHIIRIRFGDGYASGTWILPLLGRLECEVFITDECAFNNDKYVFERYGLEKDEGVRDFYSEVIHKVPIDGWGHYPDDYVKWCRVRP